MSELKITFAGQTFTFEPGQTIRIGRSTDNAVVISDPIVSREHARISWRPDGWVLDDLGKGRTFVGGLSVASVAVQQPLDVHLANPLGPQLRIEVTGTDPARADLAGANLAGAAVGSPGALGGQPAHSALDAQVTTTASTPPAGPATPAGPVGPAADTGESASVAGRTRTRHPSAVHREELW
ncbi:MAG TPA: FHA domain-containing protein, partial [Streptosporangiaceae bacterium]|nr:FHA domain-containing protein [Streptosporangiaceae bacterium]